MSDKRDSFEEGESVKARRAACGYRIQPSCANCKNLVRGWSARGFVAGTCVLHDFAANIDRGICNDFNLVNPVNPVKN